MGKALFPSPLPFWSRRISHFRLFYITIFIADSNVSPYRLSSAHPACGCQKGMLLTIDTPHVAVLRCIVRVALDSDSLIHPVTRVVPCVSAGTTRTSDFVSHHPVVHRLVAHIELDGDLMNPSTAAKRQQTQPSGSKVLMRMLARELLQGLLLRFGQFNSTFHRQAGNQDGIASQTRHSEIRLLRTLNCKSVNSVVLTNRLL
jgi:hypothetical protein